MAGEAKYLGDLVVLRGGGRHGWWYTASDWAMQRASAERIPADVAQADVLAYSPTKTTEAHRDGVNSGTVWTHRASVDPARRGGRR